MDQKTDVRDPDEKTEWSRKADRSRNYTSEQMRREILDVLSKYIEIEADDVEIAVTKSDEIEGDTVSSLIANIPIKSIRGR